MCLLTDRELTTSGWRFKIRDPLSARRCSQPPATEEVGVGSTSSKNPKLRQISLVSARIPLAELNIGTRVECLSSIKKNSCSDPQDKFLAMPVLEKF